MLRSTKLTLVANIFGLCFRPILYLFHGYPRSSVKATPHKSLALIESSSSRKFLPNAWNTGSCYLSVFPLAPSKSTQNVDVAVHHPNVPRPLLRCHTSIFNGCPLIVLQVFLPVLHISSRHPTNGVFFCYSTPSSGICCSWDTKYYV